MRIISDFHDYYDSVQRMDQDRSVIWQRQRLTAVLNTDQRRADYALSGLHVNGCGFFVKSWFLVGVAGRVFSGVRVEKTRYDQATIWSLDHLDQWISANYRQAYVDGWFGTGWRSASWTAGYKRPDFAEFFNGQAKDVASDWFERHQTPVFLVSENHQTGLMELQANTRLADVEFFKVMGPQEVYQELRMYWEAQAHPLRPIPPISDQDMVEIKGFDPRWSFRREPSKKRPRR